MRNFVDRIYIVIKDYYRENDTDYARETEETIAERNCSYPVKQKSILCNLLFALVSKKWF